MVAILQGPGYGNDLYSAGEQYLPPAGTGRRYLVFVRAGSESWHKRLILEDLQRNWDCCVSWSGAPADERLAEYYCGGGSTNKLDSFTEFWHRRPRPWKYRYIALLDDDVYLRPGELSRFFMLCDYYNLYLAQPALKWFTHATHNALVRNPACVLRRVSLVEGIAPCFSATALEDLLHTFTWTTTTRGIDWAWGCLLHDHEPLYVVDAISMEHTRSDLAADTDPGVELQRIQAMFPKFAGSRTLLRGHVYRPGVPRGMALALVVLIERMKFIVRLGKKFLGAWA